jgi:hypothetical protein
VKSNLLITYPIFSKGRAQVLFIVLSSSIVSSVADRPDADPDPNSLHMFKLIEGGLGAGGGRSGPLGEGRAGPDPPGPGRQDGAHRGHGNPARCRRQTGRSHHSSQIEVQLVQAVRLTVDADPTGFGY